MKKITTRQLTFAAMFCALSVLLSIHPFTFYLMPSVRITFREIPIYLCSFTLGPVFGGLCAFISDLIGTLIADLVLQILSFVAQSEREYIRQRQAEGIALAKAQGRYTGRKARELSAEDVERIRGMKDADAMEALGVSQSTFYRWKREGRLAG